MKNKINFLTVFSISSIAYILLYIFFDDMFIYLIGGIIGGFLKLFSNTVSPSFVIIIWLILIGVFVGLQYYLKSSLSFFLLIIIGLLLYLTDFLMYELIIENYNNDVIKYIISILKGAFLALIWYYFFRKRYNSNNIQ